MNSLTRTFLVFLRLAIGWHFLFEGIEKIQSVELGPTETSRPWSSAGYLRESVGPLGPFFRRQAGDPDEAALERLTPAPLPEGADPAQLPAYQRFPPALARDWQDYFDRFAAHYGLDADGKSPDAARQRQLAEKKLQQAKDETVRWLLRGTRKVKKTFPSGTVEVEETTPRRVDEYRSLVEHARRMEQEDLPAFGRDVWKERLRTAKSDAARARTELLHDLDEQTETMHRALRDVLTPEQKAKGPVPAPTVVQPTDRIDAVVRWGLVVVGACLLLGVFSRTACLLGAAFLLSIYLTMPPFPWVPENLRAEGHYLFVNKNLIEMLALLTLATTRSGCWAGLDGLLQFLCPRRRRGTVS